MRTAAALLFWVALAVTVPAGEPGFSAKPTVAKDGDKTKISFAVAAPTDVEVAVLDSAGKVIRHLAAGVLGAKNPPPEPLKAGLAQELVWNGKDDYGKAAEKGPFQVRVRAGTQLKVGAVLASDPFYVCNPAGMATDDEGNLYLLSSATAPATPFYHLRVFNRRGEYLRTVMPMPGNLPLEKARGYNIIPVGEKGWAPRNQNATWPDFYAAGTLQLANRVAKDGIINICGNGALLRLNADGSPVGAAPQPVRGVPGRCVAVSPDGSRLYLDGLSGNKDTANFPAGRILVWDGKEAKPFADVKLDDKVKGGDLAGMAFDGQGHLAVCDPVGGKVRIFDPAGKETGDFAVANAAQVVCHRKTGEFYVLSVVPGYGQGKKILRKFGALKDGAKEVASFPLPDPGTGACMALDDSADPAVVWVATCAGNIQFKFTAQARVYRLEDKGASFAETKHPIAFELDSVREHMAVHPETEVVAYRGQFSEAGAVNGLTGEKVALPFRNCIDMAPGQDGNWYFHVTDSFLGFICKYDRDLKPLPTDASALRANPKAGVPANAVGWAFGKWGWGLSSAGLAADRSGRVFSHQIGNEHVNGGYFVIVFGPDGKPEDSPWAKDNPSFNDHLYDYGGKNKIRENRFFSSAIVALLANQGGGLQLDPQGNIYVGTMLLPNDHKAPAGFEKDPAYEVAVGSIFKFPKEGGQFLNVEGGSAAGKKGLLAGRRFWPKGPVFAENATAVYPGLGSFAGGLGTGCSCRKPTFAVDGFGRLAIPNAITFKVRLLDNAGNEILEFGKYGNQDALVAPLKAAQEALPDGDPLKKLALSAAKPGDLNAFLKAKPLPSSEAAFGWPEAVASSERALYVADLYNHCIVRLDRGAAAEESVEVK